MAKDKTTVVNHRENIASRKLNPPANFVWCAWEMLDDGSIMLTGCVSSGLVTNGKRKGLPKYDGAMKRVVVTQAEEREERARFERETGKCAECGGDGLTLYHWNHITGCDFGTCSVCKGAGSAQAHDAVPVSA